MRTAGLELTDSEHVALPPGPRLPTVVQTVLWYRYPYWFLAACQRRYGDIFTARAIPWGTVVYLADPVEIRAVFAGDGNTFHAGEARAAARAVIGDSSLLVLDGEANRWWRRLVMPAYTGEAVRSQVEVMAALARQSIASWPLDRPIALLPRLQSIFLEVSLRVVIGTGDPARLAEMRAALLPLNDLRLAVPFMLVRAVQERYPVLKRYKLGRRYARLLARVDELLFAEIARARTDPELDTRPDVLAMLLQVQDKAGTPIGAVQVRDQLISLLLAAQEPTAAGLAWVFERLVRHPEILARTRRAAIDGGNNYLDAVVRETLRVRPVAYPTRRLARPIRVSGYWLPAGVTVRPATGLVQRSARYFTDPEDFRPERFLDTSVASDSWLTFGAGPRRCVGANLAPVGVRTVLREVLRRVDLEPTNAGPEPARIKAGISAPGRGAEVTVRRPDRDAAASGQRSQGVAGGSDQGPSQERNA